MGAFSAAPRPITNAVKIGSISLRNNLVVAPMAGVTDRPFRQPLQEDGRGDGGLGDGRLQFPPVGIGEDDPPRQPRGRGRAEGHPDRRVGPRDDGRGRAGTTWTRAPRSSTSTWAARPRRSATWPRARRSSRTSRWSRASSRRWCGAVDVPVTLKFRTGWSKENRNALAIARIAEECGIAAIALHGRTRACMYTGDAEYDTIRAVKAAVAHPRDGQRRHRLARRRRSTCSSTRAPTPS